MMIIGYFNSFLAVWCYTYCTLSHFNDENPLRSESDLKPIIFLSSMSRSVLNFHCKKLKE